MQRDSFSWLFKAAGILDFHFTLPKLQMALTLQKGYEPGQVGTTLPIWSALKPI